MKIHVKLVALILVFGAVSLPAVSFGAEEGGTGELTGPDREYRNTLMALGDRQLESGQMNEDLETFTQLLERFP